MSQIIQERTNKVIQIGNSKGFRIKSSYLEMAGMKKQGTKVTEAVLIGKHGVFIAHYLPHNQLGLEQIPDQKLEQILNGDQEKQ